MIITSTYMIDIYEIKLKVSKIPETKKMCLVTFKCSKILLFYKIKFLYQKWK